MIMVSCLHMAALTLWCLNQRFEASSGADAYFTTTILVVLIL